MSLNISISWTAAKSMIDAGSPFRWVLDAGAYRIFVFDAVSAQALMWSCVIPLDPTTDAKTDFETNYKELEPLPILTNAKTQFERTDLDLKLARDKGQITAVEGTSVGICTISIPVPGQFGTGISRFVRGGYMMLDSFDPDDFLTIVVEDTDRHIALIMAKALNPNATQPLPDSVVRAAGVIDAFGMAFPLYPTVRSFVDEDLPADNQGWYFWPLVTGANSEPYGEVDIEPMGYYGMIPAGLYVKITVHRPNVQTGNIRCDIFWGKSEA